MTDSNYFHFRVTAPVCIELYYLGIILLSGTIFVNWLSILFSIFFVLQMQDTKKVNNNKRTPITTNLFSIHCANKYVNTVPRLEEHWKTYKSYTLHFLYSTGVCTGAVTHMNALSPEPQNFVQSSRFRPEIKLSEASSSHNKKNLYFMFLTLTQTQHRLPNRNE